jgi:hypothetical protein
MKKFSFLFLLITPFIMATSIYAITYPFPENEPAYLNDEAVMKIGTKIYLFHNGTEEAKKTIKVNDVLSVYREYPADFSLETREVGKVRILSVLGEYYFEAEVIEGYVQPGNVAIKGTVACYITALKKRSHQ